MTQINIKSVNLRGTWSLNTINDECPICRNDILDVCIDCSVATQTKSCISVMGECNHVFHLDCITKWTKTRNVCPLDNKQWKFKVPCNTCPTSKFQFKKRSNSHDSDDSNNHYHVESDSDSDNE